MNGPDHYREAERLLDQLRRAHASIVSPVLPERATAVLAEAQVHALLALTAATALPTGAVGSAARDQWAHTIHFGDEAVASDGR